MEMGCSCLVIPGKACETAVSIIVRTENDSLKWRRQESPDSLPTLLAPLETRPLAKLVASLAAAGMTFLGIVYVCVLAVTTLVYLRFTTPEALRLAKNQRLLPTDDSLQLPAMRSVVREVFADLRQFVAMAVPIFAVICFGAASLAHLGFFDALARLLSPVMALFRLPGEAATAIALGSVRKDGIAIGLLDNGGSTLKVALESPVQVLTAVYLAGVLLPCLVTMVTIAREMQWSFAARLCFRQIAWASAFSLTIAWLGSWL